MAAPPRQASQTEDASSLLADEENSPQACSRSPPQGAEHSDAAHTQVSYHAGWEFSTLPPSWLLLLFCSINMLNYLDRGMIASNGVNGSRDCEPGLAEDGSEVPCTPSGIQGDFQLSNFQDGLLPTAFLVGLLAASPLFAHASKTHSPALLMATGLAVWTVAVLGCALAWGLLPLLFCRMLVGVGEASFISLAAPCISDCAAPGKVSLWLACFYLCIPVGFALGYIYGGIVASAAGWRAAFLIEALLMLPFVACLLHRSIVSAALRPAPALGTASRKLLDHTSPKSSGDSSVAEEVVGSPRGPHIGGGGDSALFEDVLELFRNPIYLRNILGYSAYTFVIGAYAFWAPKAMKELYAFDQADSLFGVITVLTGVGGTLSGGLALDYLGFSLSTAFRLMGTVTLIGGVFSLLAFLSHSLTVFVVLITIGELFLFAIQSPANVVAMRSVPPVLRALAIACSTIAVHVLGDVPSPPLLGALQDATGDFRISLGVFTVVFLPASFLWYSGSWLSQSLSEPSATTLQ